MGQVLAIGAIGLSLAGCGLLLLSWSILKILKVVTTHRICSNPRLRVVAGTQSGREYVLEMAQIVTEDAKMAACAAEKARHDSLVAWQDEIKARRREDEAIRAAEVARVTEQTIRAEFDAQQISEAIGCSRTKRLTEAQQATERTQQAVRTAQQASREVVEKARLAQEVAQKLVREAEEKSQAAQQAQEEAEERLRKGIQPIVIPTKNEILEAKTKVQYQDGLFHFAVAGVAGTGKSSLINGIRGLENRHPDAADTGVVETTFTIGRYPDPNPDYPFVWYDIPGAGTLSQPDWLYFNAQGLFVFDCVIVLFDNRFTQTDIAILKNCRRFQIPAYIVRSKADVHIRNIMYDDGYNSDHDDGSRREALYYRARTRFIADTQATVRQNLKGADLPNQRVYIISNRTLMSTVKDRILSSKIIDELELIKDILEEACSRRCATSPGVALNPHPYKSKPPSDGNYTNFATAMSKGSATSPSIPTPSIAASSPSTSATRNDAFEALIDLLAFDGADDVSPTSAILQSRSTPTTVLRDSSGRLDFGKIRSMFETQNQIKRQRGEVYNGDNQHESVEPEQQMLGEDTPAELHIQGDDLHATNPQPDPITPAIPGVQLGESNHPEAAPPHDLLTTPFSFEELNGALENARSEVLALRRQYDELQVLVAERFGNGKGRKDTIPTSLRKTENSVQTGETKAVGDTLTPPHSQVQTDVPGKVVVVPQSGDVASPNRPMDDAITLEVSRLSEEEAKTALTVIAHRLNVRPSSLLLQGQHCEISSKGSKHIHHNLNVEDIARALDFVERVDEIVWRRSLLRSGPSLEVVFSAGNVAALEARLELWERTVRNTGV
ncbi:hypothetical protein ID866_1700 [Astraeus odoratus]|nr:hypothetical protein ID866_1700 [Astraeus odoratus]